MKHISLTALIAISAGIAITPQAAQANDRVTFQYYSRELKSVEGRQSLLKRLEVHTREACAFGKSAAYASKEDCRLDLEQQLVAAIGSPLLSMHQSANDVKLADKSH